MRIAAGCLPLHTTSYLSILARIEQDELRRQVATLTLAYRSVMDPKHLLQQLMISLPLPTKKYYNLHTPSASKLVNELSTLNIQAAH